MRDFDRNFNTMSSLIKIMFLVVLLGMLTMWGIRFARMSNAKNGMYEITVPTYGNSLPDVYFATEYAERNGCVYFKDEFGFEHKACGAYQIKKW
jgi:hypothetical protein